MIYITLGENTQQLYVPTNGWDATETGDMTLTAESTIDLTTINIPVYAWEEVGSYYLLTIDLTDTELTAGEWEYSLTLPSEEATITGLLQVDGTASAETQYEMELEYKQYGE